MQTFFIVCTNEGGGVFGRARATTFKVVGNLSSGRLVATLPLRDVTLESVGRGVVVDNTWTAIAPVIETTTTDVIMLPGDFRNTYRATGRTRDAEVADTVPMAFGRVTWLTVHTMELNAPPGF